MSETIATIVTIIGTLGGWEAIRYLINRRTNKRIEEAKADNSEFAVLQDIVLFLQKQLQDKEVRFAEQTELVRKLNAENLELTRDTAKLRAERELKLCERRNCPNREPQSGY